MHYYTIIAICAAVAALSGCSSTSENSQPLVWTDTAKAAKAKPLNPWLCKGKHGTSSIGAEDGGKVCTQIYDGTERKAVWLNKSLIQ